MTPVTANARATFTGIAVMIVAGVIVVNVVLAIMVSGCSVCDRECKGDLPFWGLT